MVQRTPLTPFEVATSSLQILLVLSFRCAIRFLKKIISFRESKKNKNGRLPLLKKHRSQKSSYDSMNRPIIPRDMKRAALLMCNKVLYIRISSRESTKQQTIDVYPSKNLDPRTSHDVMNKHIIFWNMKGTAIQMCNKVLKI